MIEKIAEWCKHIKMTPISLNDFKELIRLIILEYNDDTVVINLLKITYVGDVKDSYITLYSISDSNIIKDIITKYNYNLYMCSFIEKAYILNKKSIYEVALT